MEAYCVKCKVKREMVDPEAVFTSGGTPATRGRCSVCGTTLFRMGRTEAHAGLEPPRAVGEAADRKANGKAGSLRARKRKGKLVIVESPAKARTVQRFLGQGYSVQASVGHVRDLLRSKLSVDVDNGFAPVYRVPNEKRQLVRDLKSAANGAVEVYLATDPDREGEAIAWHLLEAAEIDPTRTHRVVFHEITESAIREAFRHPRTIDMDLVNAQQARRVLDRLVGYNLSPLLWAKVQSRLSAGRVQSAALRIIVDREREIQAFVAREYWTIDAEFEKPSTPPSFRARLTEIDGQRPAFGRELEAQATAASMRDADYRVAHVKRGSRSRRPAPPFITSTLQQDAWRQLGFGARKTMVVAQQLYEGVDIGHDEPTGLITYMRTDSPQVSSQAQQEARDLIRKRYGEEFLPETPPVYKSRARGAQEAHEAVRPTSANRLPEDLKDHLTTEQHRLYSLIWRRFMASQMTAAEYDTLTIEVEGTSPSHRFGLRVSASHLRFSGFLEVYEERSAEESANGEGEIPEVVLVQFPELETGDRLELLEVFPEQHFTQAPPRYSEASLVKALEEYGIGRPSTYAPILGTLQARGYVRKESKRLVPTEMGEVVNSLIVNHFPDIVDLGFTARMEEELDEIADGHQDWVDVVREFYGPFSEQVKAAEQEMPELKAEPEELGRDCPECGKPLIIRFGRFGKFIGCSAFPACRYTEPWLEKIGARCPRDGGDLVERRTRKGRIFYGCSNYPGCEFVSWKKPLRVPCGNCGGLLVPQDKSQAQCLQCARTYPLRELTEAQEDLA